MDRPKPGRTEAGKISGQQILSDCPAPFFFIRLSGAALVLPVLQSENVAATPTTTVADVSDNHKKRGDVKYSYVYNLPVTGMYYLEVLWLYCDVGVADVQKLR